MTTSKIFNKISKVYFDRYKWLVETAPSKIQVRNLNFYYGKIGRAHV